MNRKQRKMLFRIIITVLMMVMLNFVPSAGIVRLALYMIPYLVIGYDILLKAVSGIINGQVFDENFLMAVATVGAVVIGVTGSGDYTEAIAVMLFYQIGELFQSCAVRKSRRNISELMDIRPDFANMEENGRLVQVSPEEVEKGALIIVKPGEKIPIDGIVEEGASAVDTSALTGESMPTDVLQGDEVISGSVNLSGLLKVRTTKEFGESTVSKILDLVENASSRKSRSENFISRFARVYTPLVCALALALAVLPPFILWCIGADADLAKWLYRALTFLVVSCPCALVISIPLTFFAGIGGAGKSGILIKGSNFIEVLAKCDCVVFDKTGTLTKGVFEVTEISGDEKILEYAAYAESSSTHPISMSLIKAYGKEIDRTKLSGVREISGKGVLALVDGIEVAVGNDKLMEGEGVVIEKIETVGTVIYVSVNKKYMGYIVVSDILKADAKSAVSDLKSLGIKKTVMLTGDSIAVAEKTAEDISIDEFYAGLLPGDKVNKLEEIMGDESIRRTAFAGDGINDAPVLSRADVGIAMGAIGSDAAIEAADVVLMDDSPEKIAKAIRISKKCLNIVWQNCIFSIGIKVIVLLLAALGFANMWLAVFADVGVMVIAVLNAIRALRN